MKSEDKLLFLNEIIQNIVKYFNVELDSNFTSFGISDPSYLIKYKECTVATIWFSNPKEDLSNPNANIKLSAYYIGHYGTHDYDLNDTIQFKKFAKYLKNISKIVVKEEKH